jgi:hypothetical protein
MQTGKYYQYTLSNRYLARWETVSGLDRKFSIPISEITRAPKRVEVQAKVIEAEVRIDRLHLLLEKKRVNR